ncbi:FAST kinase domain-containing protein 4 [Ochlerotatus camptorhynchus]|uniref:FAST kinase domain-containing protein 4 n=1 Tax=Ochlerotatus camptorhynchus TaxID=644619 RepID=UPI0031DCD6F3
MLSLHRFGRNFGFCIFKRNFSAPVAPFASHVTPDEGKIDDTRTADTLIVGRGKKFAKVANTAQAAKNPIVAAAFASLLQEDRSQDDSKGGAVFNEINDKIINADSVNDLLAIPGQTKVTRKQALKIVSILAEWSSIQKVKLSDFENDSRFVQLCNVLGRTNNRNSASKSQSSVSRSAVSLLQVDDLQTVLGVTANDEAAKLITGLTMPQMIKVMSSLAQKKKRSTPLLRSLAFNISSNTNKLNLKECGDLLYAMASLNFRDTVLTARICVDVESELSENKDKPAPIGSILTSLSLLRYRDTTILDLLSEWIVANSEICKPSHVSALLLSLATLSHDPSNMESVKAKLVSSLSESDFIKPTDWLNTVWSLAVLNCASSQHLASVMNTNFISSLENERNGELSPAIKMKLLNLNAFATLVEPKVTSELNMNDPKFFVPIDASKEKRVLIAGMLDALKSLLPSENHVKINQRTSMGFAIDAECVLDSKCLPLAIDKEHPGAKRIALLVHDYHDMCQGPHPSLNGVHTLACRLLEKSGYSVLSIPYNEFNTSDKLLKRVEYLQRMFKVIVSGKP